jgi:hypothetical protein
VINKHFLIALLLFPILAMSAIGTITDQKNDPLSIQRKDKKLEGVMGTGVEMQDALRTGQGTAEITFEDHTQVQMTQSAKLIIDEFVYDPANSDASKLSLKVALGTARYASGQIAKNNPQKVKINTPSATVSVRGTDFTATVDEIGATTVILLPSCPPDWINMKEDCITGAIEVESLGGVVYMDKPFEATRVPNLESKPTPPVIVDLSEEMIRQIIIVGPPKEIKEQEITETTKSFLDDNELDKDLLENELDNDKDLKEYNTNRLAENLLDRDFLKNILDILDLQLKLAQERILSTQEKNEILPDYIPDQGVTATVDTINVELCIDTTGSDIACVRVPTHQEATIRQIQGAVDITNRVNGEGTTTITTKQ